MLKRAIHALDAMLAGLTLAMGQDSPALVSFLFHALFQDERERNSDLLDPQQGITVKMFRRLVEYFLEKGYAFVSPEDLLRGVASSGKYILLTFDDGYYTNVRSIPVLEEFSVPAVFFLSTDHIQHQKSFWWDVVFRELKNRGKTLEEIVHVNAGYKRLKTTDVELCLRKEFGQAALNPVSDVDRPFTAAELKDFAAHPLVSLGNHTKDHAILTNYSDSEIQEQIHGCQDAVREMTGKSPQMIAYPNGNESPEIRKVVRDCGLQFGVLTRPGKNRLPIEAGSSEAMTLKRFTLWGDREVDAQCRISRSTMSFYRFFKDVEVYADTRLSSSRHS